MRRLNKKGQSIMEYAVTIGLVIGAITAMQLYVRSGLQARIKDLSDNAAIYIQDNVKENGTAVFTGTNKIFGTDSTALTGYEPYVSTSLTTTSGSGTEKGIDASTGGARTLTGATRERTGTTTYKKVGE